MLSSASEATSAGASVERDADERAAPGGIGRRDDGGAQLVEAVDQPRVERRARAPRSPGTPVSCTRPMPATPA